MELPTTFTMPRTFAPLFLDSRSAASVSAVSPDWLITTKAYSAQLIALYLLAMKFGNVRGTVNDTQLQDMIEDLKALPAQVEMLLNNKEKIQRFANRYLAAKDVFFIGRGIDYAISMEGSLKLKEISYIHSEAYAASSDRNIVSKQLERNNCQGIREIFVCLRYIYNVIRSFFHFRIILTCNRKNEGSSFPTSTILLIIFLYRSFCVKTDATNVPSSIREIVPCFNSPAAYASECM